jgi:hypothetical protein
MLRYYFRFEWLASIKPSFGGSLDDDWGRNTACLDNPLLPLAARRFPGAIRHWATAPLRAFQAERQEIASPRVPFFAPLPSPVAKTCRLWLPLERLRRQTRQDLAPPVGFPCGFPNPPLHSAFCSVRSAPLSPARVASPNAPFRSRLWKFTTEPGILITRVSHGSCLPPAPA